MKSRIIDGRKEPEDAPFHQVPRSRDTRWRVPDHVMNTLLSVPWLKPAPIRVFGTPRRHALQGDDQ